LRVIVAAYGNLRELEALAATISATARTIPWKPTRPATVVSRKIEVNDLSIFIDLLSARGPADFSEHAIPEPNRGFQEMIRETAGGGLPDGAGCVTF
jgi:hypothetical protein